MAVRIEADDENAAPVTRSRRAARCTFAPDGPKTRAEIAAKYLPLARSWSTARSIVDAGIAMAR